MKDFLSKKLPGLGGALWACLGSAALLAAGDVQARQPPAGKPVVAIVPDRSEQVALLADLLFAELSKSQRADLVERAELEKILAEQELQLSFGAKGGKSRRRLGSLLRADFLVLLRIGGEDDTAGLEFVIAETRFGYRLLKHVRKWDRKDVEPAAREIAALLDGSLDRFSRGVTLAVAVPPFFSRNLTHRFDHLQAALARVAEVEATRRPGCAVVELEEAKAIAEELATGAGDDRVTRPLPYYVAGEFRHETLQPDSPVSITLRLRHGAEELAELSSEGLDAAAAAKFVRKATGDLLNKIGNGRGNGIPAADPAKELKTLLNRAKGFLEVGALDQSAALYEAALLLDPDDIETLDGAVESYVRMIKLTFSRPDPGKSNKAEWEQWNELRKKEMRLKAYQAIRAGEHLTRLVRLKKYDSFYTMRDRVQSLWWTARRMTEYGRFEGLNEEFWLLEQARRDFLLHGFPHTWREKGWPDRNVKHEYTDSWFYLITVIGHPVQREFADAEWFDYRLKLFQALYKGKSRWYAPWVLLPSGCDDGSWVKRYGAGAVQKYVRLHESFVERFKQVCDDPQGLALSLEYARLQREFSHRRKQPDLVVLSELTWLYCQCRAAGIWEGERALLKLINRTAGRHYASVPRFELPTSSPRYRPPLPEPGNAVRVGRVAFQPVKLHFTGINATVPNSDPSSLSQDGAYVVVHGLVQCSQGIDVLWGPASIALMKEKGRAVEIFRDLEAEISDACFDGKWFWAGTRTGRILLVDPLEGTVRVIGETEGVPDSGVAMVICPLEPGRICAVGAIPPHARAWCATVTAEGEVNLFHEARRIAEKEDDAGADSAFKPCWIFPVQSADGKSVDRLLLCRDGLTVRSSSSAYHINRWSLACHPLVIDPRRLTVEVLEAEMPLGIAELQRKDVIQAGEFLFFGAKAVKLADMNYQIVVANPQDGGVRLRGPTRGAFQLNDMLYIPSGSISPCWIEVDPKTVLGKVIAEGRGLPRWDDYTYFRSWHYGVFGLSRSSRRPHYQVTVQEKAAAKDQ